MGVVEKIIKVLISTKVDNVVIKEWICDSKILFSIVTKMFSKINGNSYIFVIWYGKLVDEVNKIIFK